jgi:RNA polymerase sigma-70 factor, ECF subfamily
MGVNAGHMVVPEQEMPMADGATSVGVDAVSNDPQKAMNPRQGPTEVTSNQQFSSIYRDHFQAVWLTLRRFGVWERDLEDAAHDVFIVAHRRMPDFDVSRPLRPWLKGIACYVASDFRRRAQHRREVVDNGDAADRRSQGLSGHTPAHGTRADVVHEQHETRELVMWALDQMDFDRRTVLVLHDIDGHPMPDVAFALGVNINTLYSRLRHARTEFKAIVVSKTATQGGGQ